MTPSADGAPPDGMAVVEDRGSFSHAVCRVCGWSGPGRRSRRVSMRDADDHRAACPRQLDAVAPA